ncbi:helix-turn-helix domain-containing protein [Halorarum halobium]|uniref:helix-turn-helix domain-containing protein n=1 Tax=Halorarum halobium TaxID=3075121 RepID=UPI0028AB7827|nr:helix-turn-helix domain-containing protein [Halobaculum sp. XH14]
MSLVAEFRLTHPDFPLSRTLEDVPGFALRAEQLLADDPTAPTVFFWAEGEAFDSFEAAMDGDPTVARWERVETLCDRRFYRLDVDPDASVVLYPTDIEYGVSRIDFSASTDGLDVRTRFPDRETMRCYFDSCRGKGMDVSLHKLYEGIDVGEGPNDVSDKQCEALQRAAELGFFTVPRETDLGDVADSLGVSRQAASERIRRGTQALVTESFDMEG